MTAQSVTLTDERSAPPSICPAVAATQPAGRATNLPTLAHPATTLSRTRGLAAPGPRYLWAPRP